MIPSSNVRNTSGGEAVGSANNIEDIMLKNKEKILDKIPKNGQVCFIRLIFEKQIMKIKKGCYRTVEFTSLLTQFYFLGNRTSISRG